MKTIYAVLLFCFFILFLACDKTPEKAENPYKNIEGSVTPILATAQRVGNPEIGKQYLLNGDYIDSGIPREIYDATLGASASKKNELNRTGINEDLDFGLT